MGVITGILSSLPGALSQGVLWGIMALGVYITYKILDIADLTVDGSFALGASVCAVCIVGGMHPMLAILLAVVSGCIAGAVTGILHAVFDIPAILAGILTQLGLYSINLRIMGRSNTPLLKQAGCIAAKNVQFLYYVNYWRAGGRNCDPGVLLVFRYGGWQRDPRDRQ